MKLLDCSNLDSTLRSISDIVDVEISQLKGVVMGYDESRLYGDPDQMPREVLGALGCDIGAVSVDFAHYFHGTRVIEPEAFRRDGIVPLDQMIEPIWAMIYELVHGACSETQWRAFRTNFEQGSDRHFGKQYCSKVNDGNASFGPFAVLVREILLKSLEAGNHNFLECPEVVEDITRGFQSEFEIDALERFRNASRPVIVTFRSPTVPTGAVRKALWYVYASLRDEDLLSNANYGFNGGGCAVTSEDIVSVELV